MNGEREGGALGDRGSIGLHIFRLLPETIEQGTISTTIRCLSPCLQWIYDDKEYLFYKMRIHTVCIRKMLTANVYGLVISTNMLYVAKQ